MVYIEKDLASGKWPQQLNISPYEGAVPALGPDGKTDFIISYPSRLGGKIGGIKRISLDGLTEFSTSYENSSDSELAVSDLGGLDGEEAVVIKEKNVYVMKPDNSFTELTMKRPAGLHVSTDESNIIIEDIDNDGENEILCTAYDYDDYKTYLYAWNTDGTLVSNNFPLVNGKQNNTSRDPFLVLDINNDGLKELVVVNKVNSVKSSLKVYNWDGTPSDLSFEADIYGSNIRKIAAGDLDKNGKMEIIYTAVETFETGKKRFVVYLLDENLSIQPGWPVEIEQNDIEFDFGGIADMDRDGIDEIIIYDQKCINVLRKDGSPLSSAWPYKDKGLFNLSIGDVNGDNYPEILIIKDDAIFDYITNSHTMISGMEQQEGISQKVSLGIQFNNKTTYHHVEMCAFNRDAKIEKTWEIMGLDGKHPTSISAPIIGDFNTDGKVDICLTYGLGEPINKNMAVINDAAIVVYSLDVEYKPENMDWPMAYHDKRNSSVKSAKNNYTSIKGYIGTDFKTENPSNVLENFKVEIMGTELSASILADYPQLGAV